MELFKQPKFLIFMILADIVLIFMAQVAVRRKKSLLTKIAHIEMFTRLIPPETGFFKKTKMALLVAGISFIFVSLALPQWGVEFTSSPPQLGQVVIATDASLSMNAQDIAPSRMENAKMMFRVLVDKLEKYRIGVVAFAGNAYVQCPITTDADAIKYFVSRISAGMLATKGTRLSAPINLAGEMLSRYPGRKALIILTDGEDHKKGEIESALEKAKELGIVIFTVGIGSPQGSLIPLDGQYKLDEKDNPVVTRLDEDTLIKIAQSSKGAYIRYSAVEPVADELSVQLENMTKTTSEGTARQIYKNRYQIPLLIALVLLLIEFIMPERKFSLWRI